MAKLEEVEEEVKEEERKVSEARESVRSNGSGGGGGGGGSEEEGEEHDADGFETASEGREGGGSDDEEGYGSEEGEEENFARLEVKDDDEGIAGAQSSGDGVVEGEEKTFREGEGGAGAGWEAEEQPAVLTQEQEEEKRRQGVEDAIRAKAEGNSLFGQGQYEEAIAAYHRGLIACPPVQPLSKEDQLEEEEDSDAKEIREIRAVLHSNRAACFSYRQMYTEAVEESTKALELNPNYVKALMRRSQAREKLELYEDAIVDVKKVLELDPGNSPAKTSLRTLVPLAEEKRERMKNEMLSKLKEAGNSILGRFGMSVDNFKTVQDPNTGSYSIQFQR